MKFLRVILALVLAVQPALLAFCAKTACDGGRCNSTTACRVRDACHAPKRSRCCNTQARVCCISPCGKPPAMPGECCPASVCCPLLAGMLPPTTPKRGEWSGQAGKSATSTIPADLMTSAAGTGFSPRLPRSAAWRHHPIDRDRLAFICLRTT